MPEHGDLERELEAETQTESGRREPLGRVLVPGLTILYHPDLARIGERVALTGLAAGREEAVSRRQPAFCHPGRSSPRPLADAYLSRQPFRLVPGAEPGGIRLDRAGSRTAIAADGEEVPAEREIPAAVVERGAVLLLAHRVVLLLSRLDPLAPAGLPAYGLVGESPAMVRLRQEIRRVAGPAVPVLVRGETGTGKELVARALHDAGPRRSRPFLAVNLAAVPPTLAAAELFGAARGAFTGADRPRTGYFSRADGGTLFLDEVGEAPPEVQGLLLRALETGEIQPVGGGLPAKVDVRLIAATDADLDAAVAAGRFRAPLLHRLSGYSIELPPLRERREDFGRLFLHFLRRELDALGGADRLARGAQAAETRPWLPAALVARLAAYDWPGNVRQLRNAARQLALAGRDDGEAALWLQVESFFREAARAAVADSDPTGAPLVLPAAPPPAKAYRRPEEVGEEELLAALRANRWRLQPAAAQLGISRGSLYDRIDRSPGIRKAADLGRDEIEACARQCAGELERMAERLEVSKRGLQRRMTQLGIGG